MLFSRLSRYILKSIIHFTEVLFISRAGIIPVIPVISYALHGAGVNNLLAKSNVGGLCGLRVHVGESCVIIASKELRGTLTAEVAVYTAIIDIKATADIAL